VETYDDLIATARARQGARIDERAAFDLTAGPEVQLSVRLPAGLRIGVAAAARQREQTVTAFVAAALTHAVDAQLDPLVGLGDVLVDEVRRGIAAALADGSYAAAAAAVDRAEAASR